MGMANPHYTPEQALEPLYLPADAQVADELGMCIFVGSKRRVSASHAQLWTCAPLAVGFVPIVGLIVKGFGKHVLGRTRPRP